MERGIKHVKISNRGLKDLHKIRKFYTLLYGDIRTDEIIDELFELLSLLENPDADFSAIGSIDEDFTHLQYDYRKLIKHKIKITYRLGKDNIFVVRFFDTRQDPKKNL